MTPLCSIRKTCFSFLSLLVFSFLWLNTGVSQIVVFPPNDSSIVVPGFPNECQTFLASYTTEDASCPGAEDGKASLQLTPVGSNNLPELEELSFAWSGPSIVDNEPNPQGLRMGNYSVTITYTELSCSLIVNNILIKQPSPLFINCFVSNDVSIAGGQDGVAKVDCSGGALPYIIQWNGADEGETAANAPGLNALNNLRAGQYFVTVTDNCGAAQACSFTVKEPSCSNLVNVEVQNPSCSGNTDGAIFFTPNYADRTFEYTWFHDTLITGIPFRISLTPGTYTIGVRDNKGCQVEIARTLSAPAPIVIQINAITADEIAPLGQGKIEGTITGGSPPYALAWSSGSLSNIAASFTISDLVHGMYHPLATDTKNCQASSDSIRIDQIFIVAPPEGNEPPTPFIITYFDPPAPGFKENLTQQGAVLKDFCYCENGTYMLEQWETSTASIEINNTPQQPAKTGTRSDTSGFSRSLILPVELASNTPAEGECVNTPGVGTTTKHAVRVAVIDSGIDLPYDSISGKGHPSFRGIEWINSEELFDNQLDDDRNCITNDRYGYDFLAKSVVVKDAIGHGTHIAGIIADAFPSDLDLQIMNLKVYNGNNTGNVFNLTCAIHYAISKKADVINLSLGYFHEAPFYPLYEALKRAQEAGILVVVSAGNDQRMNLDALTSNSPMGLRWPASYKRDKNVTAEGEVLDPLQNLLVVASRAEDGTSTLAPYSNYGQQSVDVAAEGLITSAHLNQSYATLRGTSMAAGVVSRIAAVTKARKHQGNIIITPQDFIQKIRSTATPLSAPFSTNVGAGIVNDDSLYRAYGIDLSETSKSPVANPLRPIPVTNIMVGKQGITKPIKLGDGKTFFDNVRFTVAKSFSGNLPATDKDIIYIGKYCATNQITWDRKDKNGQTVANGVYFYNISIGNRWFTAPMKLTLTSGR